MKYFCMFLFIWVVVSCSEREEIQTPKVEINEPPSIVKFEIDSISHNSAYIRWDSAIDPENDEVKYSVELEGRTVLQNSDSKSYKFQNLEELKNYSGKIIATDSHKNITATPFTFQTKKYYLTFVKYYNFPVSDQTYGAAVNILKLSDGNYLIGGYEGTFGGYSVYLTKIDYNGNLIWRKGYDIPCESSPPTFKMKEINGEIILTASYYVAKLNLDGVLRWKKRITTYDNGYGDSTINSFTVDAEDNIYVVGTLADITNETHEKGMITKLDKDGAYIWEKQYGSTFTETGSKSMYLRFIDVDLQDNQLLVYGDLDVSGLNSNSNMSRQAFYVRKTDTDGFTIFEKTFHNSETNLGHQLIKRKNGNYLLSSSQKIIEIDKQGQELWAKTIYSPAQMYNMFYSVVETTSGNLFFIGKEGKSGTYFLTDTRGNTIWKEYYNDFPHIIAGSDVVEEADKSFRLAFTFARNYGNYSLYDEIMVIKTDPEGNF